MTLTQTAIFTKRAILIFGISLVLVILSYSGYQIWSSYKIANLPPVEEKPDLKFGVLPPPNFPPSPSPSNLSYTIDTTTGDFPKFDKILRVYFIPKAATTFLSSDRALQLAERFNIKTPPEIVSETIYRFSESNKSLTVNLDTGNFIYTNATTSAELSLKADDTMIANFKNLLNNLGLFKEEFSNGPAKLFHQNEQISQISIWPKALDNIPIVTTDFNKALVSTTLLHSAEKIDDILSLDYTFWPIDTQTFATYPSKTAAAAFEELKAGGGLIILKPTQPQVSITKVYLAYFESKEYLPYLHPVFVFEGPDFMAYVPAIANQYQTAKQEVSP